ncbi:MAG TPA: ankyrin repeat domain-containing protein [Gemmatimonas sp.]|uniref:ankyrin repeat domain-containing protein n=1 Tax=Gemmatimonas sp. TaxID=1962908 RepID=UPI002EDA7745
MADLTRFIPWTMVLLGGSMLFDAPVGGAPSRSVPPRAPAVLPHEDIRESVTKVIPLMQRSADIWFEKRACGTCHHQGVGTLSMAMLRERGFSVDTAWMRSQVERTVKQSANWQERVVAREMSINQAIGQNYRMVGIVAAGYPSTDLSRAVAYLIAGEQHASGRWMSISRRPPLEDSEVTATALSLRTLSLVPLPGREREVATRMRRGRAWLAKHTPVSTEERVMQVLGLGWTGGTSRELQPYAKALLAEQRADGGWSQVPTRNSDAYATGQVLTVLMQVARVPAADARVQRGLKFLLATQQDDGTWRVPTTRTLQAGLPYFESGFPHGKDQFISYAGTAWAVMAMVSSLQDEPTRALMGRPLRTFSVAADTVPDGLTPLHRAAMYSSMEEMRALMAKGADVNAASPMGVTPLMAAVHDVAKVRVLLDAGADMEAATKQGHTALQLAAAHANGGESARLLLAKGAKVDRPLTTSNAAKTTALSYAISRGDTLLAAMMLARGADIQGTSASKETPLMAATWHADSVGADWLLRHGALPDDGVPPGLNGPPTPLMIAAEDGAVGVLRALLRRGANVQIADEQLFTPLHYAAGAPDRGTPVIIEALLAAGARADAKAKSGEVPAAVAERFGKTWAVQRLGSASR